MVTVVIASSISEALSKAAGIAQRNEFKIAKMEVIDRSDIGENEYEIRWENRI